LPYTARKSCSHGPIHTATTKRSVLVSLQGVNTRPLLQAPNKPSPCTHNQHPRPNHLLGYDPQIAIIQHEAGGRPEKQVPVRRHVLARAPGSLHISLSWTTFAMSARNLALLVILAFTVNHARADCYTRDGAITPAAPLLSNLARF
jgi:hypothetical protein